MNDYKSRYASLPDGKRVTFTPRAHANRGFIRLSVNGRERTITGTVSASNIFEADKYLLNAHIIDPTLKPIVDSAHQAGA